ncbi:MAG: ribonuclease HI [Clostridia bacterium]|nr:ribonuclease HI [Clostridia bacterium]
MKEVLLYTDGACSGNPGRGGFASILLYKGAEKEITGAFELTTNNRMELLAVIRGLEALREPCRVKVISDSKYVVDSLTRGWVYSWRAKGWKKSDGKRALNVDLWERLLPLMERHEVELEWIKGHKGHPYNERCDALAVAMYMGDGLECDEGYTEG